MAKKPKQNTSNKENKKRKNNTEAGSEVKRKMNGDATHKGLKVDKNEKVAKDSQSVANKLDSSDKLNKVVENGDKVKQKVKKRGKDVTKVIANGILKNQVKHNIQKVQNKTQNNEVNMKKKEQKTIDKVKSNENNKNIEIPTSTKIGNKHSKIEKTPKIAKNPTLLVNKVKQFQKQTKKLDKSDKNNHFESPKKVKFVLKNNSKQEPVDYYKSVRQSPSIPFDGTKRPSKTNLKPSTPSPINPFFKKKLKHRK